MVNTFLVTADFSESARYLDRQRLGKQRVEAYQILNVCSDLRWLGNHYGIPFPTNNIRSWIQEIARRYKKSDQRLYQTSSNVMVMTKEESISFLKKTKGKWASNLKWPIKIGNHQIHPDDRLITLGWCYHPIVQMWIGFEDSLKLYINAHIDEFVRRGYNNNMKKYLVDPSVQRPKWTFDPIMYDNHRGALLQKEITRNEPIWYQDQEMFLEASPFDDYIWVSW